MADVQITIRLGWEASVDLGIFPRGNMGGNNVADKVRRAVLRWDRGFRGFVRCNHKSPQKLTIAASHVHSPNLSPTSLCPAQIDHDRLSAEAASFDGDVAKPNGAPDAADNFCEARKANPNQQAK